MSKFNSISKICWSLVLLATVLVHISCNKDLGNTVTSNTPVSTGAKILSLYYPSYAKKADGTTGFYMNELLNDANYGIKGLSPSPVQIVPSFAVIGDGATAIGNETGSWFLNNLGIDDVWAWARGWWDNGSTPGTKLITLTTDNAIYTGQSIIGGLESSTQSLGLAVGGWPANDDPADPLRTGGFMRITTGSSATVRGAAMKTFLHSIGQYASSQGSDATVNNKIKTFFTNVGTFHIDWEFPLTSDEGNRLFWLCKGLKDSFPSKKVSIAVGPNLKKHLMVLPWADLITKVDYVEIMTYDYNGAWNNFLGHQTALYNSRAVNDSLNVDDEVKYLIAQGVPASKILIGVALYGRAWNVAAMPATGAFDMYAAASAGSVTSTANFDAGTVQVGGVIKYNAIKTLIAANSGWEEFYDNTANAPYLINRAKKTFITYDNMTSINAKISYVRNKGLAGVLVWDASGAYGTTVLKDMATLLQ